mmetsp:Transcript_17624/g.40793  ORF Transcript_17624/g.40793 Transcript_17624/m.40793 type:complete len:205 (+) Transcript_17624:315-929(+)
MRERQSHQIQIPVSGSKKGSSISLSAFNAMLQEAAKRFLFSCKYEATNLRSAKTCSTALCTGPDNEANFAMFRAKVFSSPRFCVHKTPALHPAAPKSLLTAQTTCLRGPSLPLSNSPMATNSVCVSSSSFEGFSKLLRAHISSTTKCMLCLSHQSTTASNSVRRATRPKGLLGLVSSTIFGNRPVSVSACLHAISRLSGVRAYP